MLNLVESLENLDFLFEISENRDFCRNFRKVSILARIFENSLFWSEFKKISILVEIFGKSRFWSKCPANLDFGQNVRKSRNF